jgi:hypothetical protein
MGIYIVEGLEAELEGVVRNVSFVCEIGIYKAKPKLIIRGTFRDSDSGIETGGRNYSKKRGVISQF